MSSKLYLKRPTGVMDSGFGLVFCPRNLCSGFHEWNSRILFQCHFIHLGGIYVLYFWHKNGANIEVSKISILSHKGWSKWSSTYIHLWHHQNLIWVYGQSLILLLNEYSRIFIMCRSVLQRHLPSTKYIEYKVREIIIWCLAGIVSLLTYNEMNRLSFLW